MKRYIFMGWLLLSLILAFLICNSHLPIRDEHFPSVQDYTNSVIFLCGEAIILSTITSAGFLFYKERRERIILSILTAVLLLVLYGYMFYSLLTLYLLIAEGTFILLAVGAIHFLMSFILKRILVKE